MVDSSKGWPADAGREHCGFAWVENDRAMATLDETSADSRVADHLPRAGRVHARKKQVAALQFTTGL